MTLPSEGDTSAVSVLTSDQSSPAPETIESEDLALPCIEILDVTPTTGVAPGDQIEIEARCLLTSNPDQVMVTFGIGSEETTTVTADSIDGSSRKTIVATVPDGANDGPVEIKVGLFRSAISSVSIDIVDESENLALPCIEILDVTPTTGVAPGDQIEIETRCLLTSNPDRVTVTFGVGSEETTTVTADSIDGSLRKTIVATVPDDGANDGPVEIKIGLFRSAMSSVSIDFQDPEPGVLWIGSGVELRVAEDLSQVFRFSYDLTGPDGCELSGSFGSPITVDPDGSFFVDGFSDDISGEFTSATSASGTVDRGEGACVADWTASPQSSQPPTPTPSPTPKPLVDGCVTDTGDTATSEDLEDLLSDLPSLITLTTGEIEITGPVTWTNGIAFDPALELQAFFLGDPERGPVDLMIDRFIDSSFSAEDVNCGSATQPGSSCEFELTLPDLGALLSVSGPADYAAVLTFFDGAGSNYACTKLFEFSPTGF